MALSRYRIKGKLATTLSVHLLNRSNMKIKKARQKRQVETEKRQKRT